jgi:hypothetical protein
MVQAQTLIYHDICFRNQGYPSTVADIFIDFSHVFQTSQLYIMNYNDINIILSKKLRKSKFQTLLPQLALEFGHDLQSCLITPIQRMP